MVFQSAARTGRAIFLSVAIGAKLIDCGESQAQSSVNQTSEAESEMTLESNALMALEAQMRSQAQLEVQQTADLARLMKRFHSALSSSGVQRRAAHKTHHRASVKRHAAHHKATVEVSHQGHSIHGKRRTTPPDADAKVQPTGTDSTASATNVQPAGTDNPEVMAAKDAGANTLADNVKAPTTVQAGADEVEDDREQAETEIEDNAEDLAEKAADLATKAKKAPALSPKIAATTQATPGNPAVTPEKAVGSNAATPSSAKREDVVALKDDDDGVDDRPVGAKAWQGVHGEEEGGDDEDSIFHSQPDIHKCDMKADPKALANTDVMINGMTDCIKTLQSQAKEAMHARRSSTKANREYVDKFEEVMTVLDKIHTLRNVKQAFEKDHTRIRNVLLQKVGKIKDAIKAVARGDFVPEA